MPAPTRPAWRRRGAWSAPGGGGPERGGEEILGAAVGTGDELGGVSDQRAVVQSELEAVHAPRAGPWTYSPPRSKTEPWQGHSNLPELLQNGTRQPRWGQRWERAKKWPPALASHSRPS